MNIFFLSEDPIEAANQMCDKHVVKMIIETAQLICTAYHLTDDNNYDFLYGITHKNHPSAIWVRTSIPNYIWTVKHFEALCDEYTTRYKKQHATDLKFRKFFTNNIPNKIQLNKLTEKPCATNDDIRSRNLNIVESYKQYYALYKYEICQWNHSQKPEWFEEYAKKYSKNQP